MIDKGLYERLVRETARRKPRLPKRYVVEVAVERLFKALDEGQVKLGFLEDFKIRERGMSASSPKTYATWLRWAIRFHQRLGLPTAGHVDRLVNQYFEEQYG
jgi:hypothetical protein